MFETAYRLWAGSLQLQHEAFSTLDSPDGMTWALAIFVLAATSRGLADAGVMMINRVTKAQFVRGLVGGPVLLTVVAITWAGCIWLALRGGLGIEVAFERLLCLVFVSYAPLVLGVFSIIPHAGLLWSLILRVWMLLITVAGLHQHFQVPLLYAVAASGVGWLLFQLITELFRGKYERLRFALIGRHRWVRPKEAAEQLLARRMAGQ